MIRRTGVAGDGASFRREALAGLHQLAGCEIAHFGLLDPVGQLAMAFDEPAGSIGSAATRAAFERHHRQDPWVARLASIDEPRALKISDFLSVRQWTGTDLYNECHRLIGGRYEIGIELPGDGATISSVVLLRQRRDFGERERDLLTLLGPHLAAGLENAELRQLYLASEGLPDRGAGVILLSPFGTIVAANQPATKLISAYFDRESRPPYLPADLGRWIASQRERRNGDLPSPPGASLSIAGARGTLLARFLPGAEGEPDAILLSEARPLIDAGALREHGLTTRQIEVLERVERGKPDKRIALELGISVRTVRKHLDRVHAKLGVSNRTAAAAEARALSTGRG